MEPAMYKGACYAWVVFGACGVMLLGASVAAGGGAGIQALARLDAMAIASRAHSSSDDGSVVAGRERSEFHPWDRVQALRWTPPGAPEVLVPPLSGETSAWDVSADGSVIVGEHDSWGDFQAFRWTQAGGMVLLTDPDESVSLETASSVSANGSVIVGSGSSASGGEAFRWTESGGADGLGDLDGGDFNSWATGVSADGSVVAGGSISTSGYEAFRWTQGGGMEGLGDLDGGAFHSEAHAVSADGLVIVGSSDSASSGDQGEAFRWTEGDGMVPLGDLPGGLFRSTAYAASGDGSIVVGRAHSDAGQEAFIWDADNGMVGLREALTARYGIDMTGWHLDQALDISTDGRVIVGWGSSPGSEGVDAWIVILPLLGDANLDGCVDDLDLTAVAVHWQESTGLWAHGDFNADGIVDDLDLTALAVNWQQGCGGGGSFAGAMAAVRAAVPEPVSALILVLGLVGVVGRRGRN